jgi:hypothetical protein
MKGFRAMDNESYSPYAPPQATFPPAATAHAPSPVVSAEQQQLQTQVKQGAGWFMWVAVLSMLNSIFMIFQVNISFCIGLGITPLVAGIVTAIETPEAAELSAGGKGAAMVMAALGLLFFFSIFFFANRGHRWAFILGMLAYAVDGLIFLLFGDFLSIGFHIFALYWMFVGVKAAFKLNRMPKQVLQLDNTINYA